MFKAFGVMCLAACAHAYAGQSHGYAMGVPPTTQNCNSYPKLANGAVDKARQDISWGLVVDREFGGCKCADDDAVFKPHPRFNAGNAWSCVCTNDDFMPSMPEDKYITVNTLEQLNDNNGKKCGVIRECL